VALHDAAAVGFASEFQTTVQNYACLVGLSLRVYTAPAEFPGLYVAVGTCIAPYNLVATWTFPIVAPPRGPSALWQSRVVYLTLVPDNVSVGKLNDAKRVGQVDDFETNDPASPYVCFNGLSLDVWTAPAEFPSKLIAYGGCTDPKQKPVAWTFPQVP